MKTKFTLCIVAVSLFTSFIASAQVPQKKGSWKFDESFDLTLATIGSPLVVTGSVSSVSGPDAGNLAIEVVNTPELKNFLTITHGIAANGGGAMVNEYSLLLDISIPALELWYAMYQTAPDGDAELFINKTGNVGASRYTYSTLIAETDTWYRVVVTVKNGEFFKIYLNGDLWVDGAGQAVDSRDALLETLDFFNDDDGEVNTLKCSELGIWDVALTQAQVTELGNPSTVGIFNPKSQITDELGKNYPNPFSLTTTFPYQIKEAGNVVFRVYDITGKEVLAPFNEAKTPGNYNFELNGTNLTNGVYFVQMKANDHTSTQRMTVSH